LVSGTTPNAFVFGFRQTRDLEGRVHEDEWKVCIDAVHCVGTLFEQTPVHAKVLILLTMKIERD
jgi:hypothetical protein